MTITAIILVILVVAAAYGALLARSIRNDGQGRAGRDRRPPRSHHADPFEARSFLS